MGERYNAEFKAKVAISAIKEEMRMAEMSSKYEVRRSQINSWRKLALDEILHALKEKPDKNIKDKEKLIDEFYRQIGQLNLGQPYLMWQLHRQPELVWSIKSRSYIKIS